MILRKKRQLNYIKFNSLKINSHKYMKIINAYYKKK